VEQLGSGGQAEVYRAVHPTLGRDVVIKWAHQSLPEAAQQMLIDEGKVLARLDAPGLVRVYDVDLHEGRPFVVMEFVHGRTLQQQLKDRPPSPRQAAALVGQLAQTLERVHQQGACHRDLKPLNVLIDAGGRPRLLDFGLALMDQPWSEPRRQEGDVSGTYQYMAPEQANGDMSRIGPRTDVFGLGGILYALLTGRPPYQGPEAFGVWEQARQGKVVPPRQLNRHLPRSLEKICLKALAADPQERFASAGEMARALRSYLRRPWMMAVASFLAGSALLIGLAVYFGLFRSSAPAAPLSGKLIARLLLDNDPGRNLLSIGEDPRAVPVRNGDGVRLEVRLNQPAHIYLLWVDGASGEVFPLYPWNQGHTIDIGDLHVPPPVLAPRQEVSSPPEKGNWAWKVKGKSGLETVLLLARREPVSGEVSWPELIGQLASPGLQNPKQVVFLGFERGKVAAFADAELTRGLEVKARQVDEPLLRQMERLPAHFDWVQAIRFAHQGD
jgi:tRNA A-37 threonylcarbamoyl transferase component Bud32